MGVDTIRGKSVCRQEHEMKDSATMGEGWCWDDDNPVLSPLLISRKDVFMERFLKELRDAGVVVRATIGEDKPDAFVFAPVSQWIKY